MSHKWNKWDDILCSYSIRWCWGEKIWFKHLSGFADATFSDHLCLIIEEPILQIRGSQRAPIRSVNAPCTRRSHPLTPLLTHWGVWLMSFAACLPVISKCNYDHVVEEHFKRSLGLDYQKARSQLSISVSVDDHFAKALGDKWLQIKSKSSSCSSTPPSSPSVTHSPTYSHSQNQCHKEPTSSSSPNCSHWAVN